MTNPLAFLTKEENSSSREAILMHRLLYDLQCASARRGYFLESYRSEVDQDGFDLILDDRDRIMKIQVKSVSAKGTTNSWGIHKSILRPSPFLADNFRFECAASGVQGGVILMVFDYKDKVNDLTVDYYYTDICVLAAFELGVLAMKHSKRQKALSTLMADLRQGRSRDQVSTPSCIFLQAKSTEHLLALMGFHSGIQSSWSTNLIRLAGHLNGFRKEDPGRMEHLLKKYLPEEIGKLTHL